MLTTLIYSSHFNTITITFHSTLYERKIYMRLFSNILIALQMTNVLVGLPLANVWLILISIDQIT